MCKKIYLCLSYCLLTPIAGVTQLPEGILGGQDNGAPWAAFLDSSGNLHPIAPALLPSSGNILSVDINAKGMAIIGGLDNNSNAYVAFTAQPKNVTPVIGLPTNTQINTVAINNANQSAISGNSPGTSPTSPTASQIFYAATITSNQTLTTVASLPGYSSENLTATINNQGYIIFGGQTSTFHAYGILENPWGQSQIFHDGSPPGYYLSAAMNSSSFSILGGGDGNSYGSWASFVYPDGTEVQLPISGDSLPAPLNSQIRSVSINDSGNALIGGFNSTGIVPYAALVTSTGNVTNLPVSGDSLPATGKILSVAINASGEGLIGGYDGSAAYAAFISSSGNVSNLSMPATGVINSVAITDYGAGLVGGQNGTAAYAALISPSGQVTSLSGLPLIGSISSVALGTYFSQIPTLSLSGNNKRFAEYITHYAPKDIFYFIPSYFDGTLSQALESAAPTRNALSLFSVDNNLFFLNTGLSTYLRSHRYAFSAPQKKESSELTFLEDDFWAKEDELSDSDPFLASTDELDWLIVDESEELPPSSAASEMPRSSRPYTLWGEALGALATQKAQHQTPGFDPTSVGFILGLDRFLGKHIRTGGCFSYLFTHVHEQENAGFSQSSQELLCLYASGFYRQFYADLAVWTGLFQTHQQRNIKMTGFHFKASSHPGGVQLAPHLELGYDWKLHPHKDSTSHFTINPFFTTDWVTAWQEHFKEKGGGPFNAGQRPITGSFLRIETGLRGYETITFNNWSLSLEQKASYVYRNPFELGTINAFLVGSPGSFTVTTLSSQESLGVVGASCFFKPASSRYPYGSLAYQGEFSEAYRSNQLTMEVAWDF